MADSGQTYSWLRSTASGGGNCVEVAFAGKSVLVRNSLDPLGSVLSFSLKEWEAFLAGATNGEFTPKRGKGNTA